MSGGKGGSTTSQVEIPEWLEQASQRNIGRAEQAQQIGYMPYYGPDIAAFSPAQQTAMQSSYDAAAAFGLAPQGGDVMAGMPKAQDFGGGFMGYSSAPLYEQALAELQAKQPGQVEQYNRMFVDPITGAPAENFMRAQADQAAQAAQSGQMMGSGDGGNGNMGGEYSRYGDPASGLQFTAGETYQSMQGNPIGMALSPGLAVVGGLADRNLQSQGYGYVRNPDAKGGGYYTRNRDSGGSDRDDRDEGATDSMRGERGFDGWGE